MKNKKFIVTLFLTLISVVYVGQNSVEFDKTPAVKNALKGFSSDISGSWAIVGSPQRDLNNKKSIGGVLFYRLAEGKWNLFQEIYPDDLKELNNFGTKVSLDGNTAVISSIGDHEKGLFSGAVYVYEFNYDDQKWERKVKLKSSDTTLGDKFGQSVEIKNGLIVVGALNSNGANLKTGAAYVFEKINNQWIETSKIFADTGKSNSFFGFSLSILDSNHVAVGAYNDDGNNERSGVVYLFKKNINTWNQSAKIYDENGLSSDLFGYSLASMPSLSQNNDSTKFEGILYIGAPGTNENDLKTGAVYFYKETTSGWEKGLKLIESDSNHNDHFGVSVSSNEYGKLLVGASRVNTDSKLNSGKVYMYDTFEGQGNSIANGIELTKESEIAYNYYGAKVVIDEENILISSPYSNQNSLSNSGEIHFYKLDIEYNTSSNEDLFSLKQNIPNSFINSTTLEYSLKLKAHVKIEIFDVNGRLVQILVDEVKDFGVYNQKFNSPSSGLYVCKITIGSFTKTIKMLSM
jgi:hypothetical protein